jgi:hypothetical protein
MAVSVAAFALGDAQSRGCAEQAAAQGIGVSGDRAGKPLLRLVVPARLPERPRAADATDAPIAEVCVVWDAVRKIELSGGSVDAAGSGAGR